ncbi:histidine kinase [Hymenobacter sp. HMF4947]|uniref:Histidine kinase n=1 Tax=Hymenobacter ginkgonis TaxID=2682976 RepID=A0A7K1TFE3_9BACT|nr:sensor histidine kinase [Hymenobacter ginkgonis]MVN77130.1 histidine kinase [Hymenobacter ginkgonis]
MAFAPTFARSMNDRRFLLFGIPGMAALSLVPRGVLSLPVLPFWPASYAVSLTFTLALWLGNRQLWQWLLRRWPEAADTARRLWWLAGLGVAYTLATTLGLGAAIVGWQGGRLRLPQELREIGLNLVATFIVLLLYESMHFFQQWQANLRRADQLARAQTQAQLDALAQQLDPHFLFNSLNTLAALIEPQNEPAQHYVEGLADVYRYVLLSRERPTVPLAEELAFVQTYVALQKVRFRENVQVHYHIPTTALAQHVAPLSVQLLVENALKHNEASQARPLHLRLVADAAATVLRVENAWQPRTAGLAPSTSTGLANVRQRYALLGAAQPVAVEQAAGIFAVTLPLLPPT